MRGEPLIVNMVGIEIAADLFLELSVAFVRGIADDIEEFGIAPRAADIFRRASPLGREEAGIGCFRVSVDEGFELDPVSPVVPEVVDVFEDLVAGLSQQVL